MHVYIHLKIIDNLNYVYDVIFHSTAVFNHSNLR